MPPVGFEPTISAGERPKTYALDRAATGTGERTGYWIQFFTNSISILNNIVNALKMVYLEPKHYFDACWGTFNILVLNYLKREICNFM